MSWRQRGSGQHRADEGVDRSRAVARLGRSPVRYGVRAGGEKGERGQRLGVREERPRRRNNSAKAVVHPE